MRDVLPDVPNRVARLTPGEASQLQVGELALYELAGAETWRALTDIVIARWPERLWRWDARGRTLVAATGFLEEHISPSMPLPTVGRALWIGAGRLLMRAGYQNQVERACADDPDWRSALVALGLRPHRRGVDWRDGWATRAGAGVITTELDIARGCAHHTAVLHLPHPSVTRSTRHLPALLDDDAMQTRVMLDAAIGTPGAHLVHALVEGTPGLITPSPVLEDYARGLMPTDIAV